MNKREFNEWVNYQIKTMGRQIKYDTFKMIKCETGTIVKTVPIDTIIVTINFQKRYVCIVNTQTGKIGIAKCHKDDKMDMRTGVAIAWARYNKLPIPIITSTTLSELKTNRYFETLITGKKYYLVGYTPDKKGVVCLESNGKATVFPWTKEVKEIKSW